MRGGVRSFLLAGEAARRWSPPPRRDLDLLDLELSRRPLLRDFSFFREAERRLLRDRSFLRPEGDRRPPPPFRERERLRLLGDRLRPPDFERFRLLLLALRRFPLLVERLRLLGESEEVR